MRRRDLLADLLVGTAAFAISVAVLQADRPVDDDLRSVDVWAYVVLAAYSFSVVLRRVIPAAAAVGGVFAGVVYAAAHYPPALTPVVLLSVYSAAARLPQREARAVLAGTLVLGTLGSTLGPGPFYAAIRAGASGFLLKDARRSTCWMPFEWWPMATRCSLRV